MYRVQCTAFSPQKRNLIDLINLQTTHILSKQPAITKTTMLRKLALTACLIGTSFSSTEPTAEDIQAIISDLLGKPQVTQGIMHEIKEMVRNNNGIIPGIPADFNTQSLLQQSSAEFSGQIDPKQVEKLMKSKDFMKQIEDMKETMEKDPSLMDKLTQNKPIMATVDNAIRDRAAKVPLPIDD